MVDAISLVNTNYASNPIKRIGISRQGDYSSTAVRPQLGIASLYAYLKSKEPGIEAYLVDAVLDDLTPERTAELALNENPGAIGVSATYHNYEAAFGVLRYAKKENPEMVTILGGPGARSLFDLTCGKCIDGIDYCLIGDGEQVLQSILKENIIPKKTKYLHGFVKDLDILPSPYDINPETGRPFLDGFDVEGYFEANRNLSYHGRSTNGKLLTDYASKGCNKNCRFCSTKTAWRGRSPKELKQDLENIKQFYGTDCELFVVDDNPTSGPEKWLIDTYKVLGESGIPWITQIRVDEAMEKCGGRLPKIMADCGCVAVSIGAESGSQKVLDMLNKGITPEQTLRAVKDFSDNGININMFLMYNCPGEGKSELDETLSMVRKALDSGGISTILAFEYVSIPGSRAYCEGLKGSNLSDELKEYFCNKLLDMGQGRIAVIPETYK